MAENDPNSGWEVTKEGDRVIRRRVYTIPAESHGETGETGFAAEQNSNQIDKKNTKNSGKPRKKPLTKQQRMVRQIKAQREMEWEQHEAFESQTNSALQDQILKYLKTVWIIVTVGVLLLYFYAPEVLNKWMFGGDKERLANRSLMTIYPSSLQVRKSLPLIYNAYAVAKRSNLPARKAVKHVAEFRKIATYPGTKYRQKIALHAWEHVDFFRQLRNHSMDEYCGSGFQRHYKDDASASTKKRDDLLFWCLLTNGHHDGFIKFETTEIRSPIARGRKGVACRYVDHNRIHSDSFVFLPLHDLKDLQNSKKKRLPPSTMVAFAALEWLRTNAPLPEDAYKKFLEEFLYEWIDKEKDSWVLFNAACSRKDRQGLALNQRLIATTCKKPKQLKLDADTDSFDENVPSKPDHNDDSEEEEECCSFYDPNLEPFLR